MENKVNTVFFDNVVEPGSAFPCSQAVIYRLVEEHNLPFCLLVGFQIVGQPFPLGINDVLILIAVASRVQHDKMGVAVIIGINRFVGIVKKLQNVSVGHLALEALIESRRTSVVGMVEVVIEIKRCAPGIVVADGGKHWGGRTKAVQRLEIHIPHILVVAGFHNIAGVKNKRRVLDLFKSLLVCRHGEHEPLVACGQPIPGDPLGIAHGNKRKLVYAFLCGLELEDLRPIGILVAVLFADLIFIFGIGRKRRKIALEVILICGIHPFGLPNGVNRYPIGFPRLAVFEGHGILADKCTFGRPGEITCRLCLVKRGYKIIDLRIHAGINRLLRRKRIFIDTARFVLYVGGNHLAFARDEAIDRTAPQQRVEASANDFSAGSNDLNGLHFLIGADDRFDVISTCPVRALNGFSAHL